MANKEELKNLLYPRPCRKKVDRMWVKQALGKFVGACGAAATAAVVSVVVNQSPLKAQAIRTAGEAVSTRVVATQPASQPATQASQLSPQQKTDAEKLVAKLDADDVATRDAATKQLKEMGQPVVAFLKDFSTNNKLSSEAAARVQSIIETFNPPEDAPKAKPLPPPGAPVMIKIQQPAKK